MNQPLQVPKDLGSAAVRARPPRPPDRRARASQFEFLADLIYQRRHVIVMGDMNSATDSPEMNSFVQASQLHVPGAAEHTFPS